MHFLHSSARTTPPPDPRNTLTGRLWGSFSGRPRVQERELGKFGLQPLHPIREVARVKLNSPGPPPEPMGRHKRCHAARERVKHDLPGLPAVHLYGPRGKLLRVGRAMPPYARRRSPPVAQYPPL